MPLRGLFSSCSERGLLFVAVRELLFVAVRELLFVAVRGLLIVVVSLVTEHRL